MQKKLEMWLIESDGLHIIIHDKHRIKDSETIQRLIVKTTKELVDRKKMAKRKMFLRRQ